MRLGDLVPELRDHGHRCWRKERQTRGKAEAHLRQLLRSDGVEGTDRLQVYHCLHCGEKCPRSARETCTHWHVGRHAAAATTTKEDR